MECGRRLVLMCTAPAALRAQHVDVTVVEPDKIPKVRDGTPGPREVLQGMRRRPRHLAERIINSKAVLMVTFGRRLAGRIVIW